MSMSGPETREQALEKLARVGWVLIAVGALEAIALAYCVANGISFSSSLIFGLLAGAFLVRGSFRAAAVTRSFAGLLLGLTGVLPFSFLVLPPWPILKNSLLFVVGATAYGLTAFLVIGWTWRSLCSPVVTDAVVAAGQRPPRLWVPWVAAIAFALFFLAVHFSLGSTRDEALARVRSDWGDDYQYWVGSASTAKGTHPRSRATVHVYRPGEIHTVELEW